MINNNRKDLLQLPVTKIQNRNVFSRNRKISIKNLENKNGKENNNMDISRDKHRKLQMG